MMCVALARLIEVLSHSFQYNVNIWAPMPLSLLPFSFSFAPILVFLLVAFVPYFLSFMPGECASLALTRLMQM